MLALIYSEMSGKPKSSGMKMALKTANRMMTMSHLSVHGSFEPNGSMSHHALSSAALISLPYFF